MNIKQKSPGSDRDFSKVKSSFRSDSYRMECNPELSGERNL